MEGPDATRVSEVAGLEWNRHTDALPAHELGCRGDIHCCVGGSTASKALNIQAFGERSPGRSQHLHFAERHTDLVAQVYLDVIVFGGEHRIGDLSIAWAGRLPIAVAVPVLQTRTDNAAEMSSPGKAIVGPETVTLMSGPEAKPLNPAKTA